MAFDWHPDLGKTALQSTVYRSRRMVARRLGGYRRGSVKIVIALAAMLAGFPAVAQAEGDAEAGAKVFNRCRACHVADKEQNRVGPHLVAVSGRPLASVDGFRYSEIMVAKGAEGAVWDDVALAAYLTDPRAYMPGNTMAFTGLKKPKDVEDVIAYLKSVGSR